MSIVEKVTISIEERKQRAALFPSRIDYQKVMELNDGEFAQLHLELMTEYKTQDGWWGEGEQIPTCRKCNGVVEGPEHLVRYHGMNMHHSCFKSFWKEEIETIQCETDKFMLNYWGRVASLD